MNNSQFRDLLASDGTRQNDGSTPSTRSASQPFKTPMLGSRARSSIPMTPRVVAGYHSRNDLARQVAEHQRRADGEPAVKRFKSTAAPKGTKLARGYHDRTAQRRAAGDDGTDDKEQRLKALEEMYTLQQIDAATFERLQREIGVGGDVSSTHLVKGLDWELLKRVKRGEDVNAAEPDAEDETADAVDVDGELDRALEQDVSAAARKPAERDEPAPAAPDAPILSRDEILRRLKESRRGQAPPVTASASTGAPPPESALGAHFKKLNDASRPDKKRFTETVNGRQREVLLTTGPDGRTKRKVRWLGHAESPSGRGPTAAAPPLGMAVPAELAAKQQAMLEEQQRQEESDDDIFAGVGADYNPLADIGDEEDSDERDASDGETQPSRRPGEKEKEQMASAPGSSRNYFGTSEPAESATTTATEALQTEPTILAALKRAAALRSSTADTTAPDGVDSGARREDEQRQQALLARLQQRDRDDARDLDLGFGGDRFGDDEDEEAFVEGGTKGGGVRKRGPKKRKGDKDSVQDVMGVLEGRTKKA